MSAAAVAMLWWAGAHITAAAGADSMDTLSVSGPLDGREQVRAPDARCYRVAASAPGAAIDASSSDLLARLHYAFGRDPGLSSDRAHQDEREVLLRNSDAFVRTKLQLTQSKEWRGFVYADIGATDSALRWQGLAGIHGRLGVDVLGGWRHVTYHFTPGRGFDSLEFKGPFLGATVAW